jgi:hypothetical protein
MTRRHTAGRAWRVGVVLAAVTSLLAAEATPKKTEKPKTPENKVATLEDFYGDTGKAIPGGAVLLQPRGDLVTISPNVNGYGIGVDDMFISWKETRLDEDTTTCAGECADLEVKSTLTYEAVGFVEADRHRQVSLRPGQPERTTATAIGSYADVVDDQDCNDNGTTDVVVRLSSLDEPTARSRSWTGSHPGARLSRPYPLFRPVRLSGIGLRAILGDRQRGDHRLIRGSQRRHRRPLRQRAIPGAGRVPGGEDDGDDRGRAHRLSQRRDRAGARLPGRRRRLRRRGETIDMTVRLRNQTGLDLDDLVVSLVTTDPKIECISVPVVAAGSVLKGAYFTTPPFRVKVAAAPAVQRTRWTRSCARRSASWSDRTSSTASPASPNSSWIST